MTVAWHHCKLREGKARSSSQNKGKEKMYKTNNYPLATTLSIDSYLGRKIHWVCWENPIVLKSEQRRAHCLDKSARVTVACISTPDMSSFVFILGCVLGLTLKFDKIGFFEGNFRG